MTTILILLAVPLILVGVYLVKNRLQNTNYYDTLDEQRELEGRLKLARQLSPEQIRENRAQIERNKKELH